jgi:hypothetical protein
LVRSDNERWQRYLSDFDDFPDFWKQPLGRLTELTDWQRDFAPFQSGCGIRDDAEITIDEAGSGRTARPRPGAGEGLREVAQLGLPVRDVATGPFNGCGGLLVGVEGGTEAGLLPFLAQHAW